MEIKLDIRDKFLKKIRSTIIGPLDKDEVLNVSPKTKYLYGYISPAPKSDDDAPISDTISDATKLSPSAIKKNSKNTIKTKDL